MSREKELLKQALFYRANDMPLELFAECEAELAKPEPPARKPLSDEEIEQCLNNADYSSAEMKRTPWTHHFARAIEKAHGIKKGEA